MNWFGLIILSTLIYGLIDFMYKIAAVYNLPSVKILNSSAITVSVFSLIIIFSTKSQFTDFKQILFFAILNSSFFALGTIAKIKSLKNIPTSFSFPITKLNAAFLIIYALIIFNEKPTLNQWIGILISFSILIFISVNVKNEKIEPNETKHQFVGILMALLSAFSTSISMLTGKFASTDVPKLNYIFISYLLVFLYTQIINKTLYHSVPKPKKEIRNKIILFGIIIGILNFVGYFLVLSAFAAGPLSLIQGIWSNSFIIPIFLSLFIFKEKFTLKNIIVVVLSIISILLIKL